MLSRPSRMVRRTGELGNARPTQRSGSGLPREHGAAVVDDGEHGPGRQRVPGRHGAQPAEADRGVDHGAGPSVGAGDGPGDVQRGRAGDAADLVLADGERPGGERAPEVEPVGQVHGTARRQRAGDHVALQVDEPQVRVARRIAGAGRGRGSRRCRRRRPFLLEQVAEDPRAGGRVALPDLREPGEQVEQRARVADGLVDVAGGLVGEAARLGEALALDEPPSLEVLVQHEPEHRQGDEQHQPRQSHAQRGEEADHGPP